MAKGKFALANHLVDAGGPQPRILLQDLADEGQVSVGGAGAQRVGVLEAVHFQGITNGVGVEAKGLGDGADFPVLSEELMPDVSARLGIDHGSRSLLS